MVSVVQVLYCLINLMSGLGVFFFFLESGVLKSPTVATVHGVAKSPTQLTD